MTAYRVARGPWGLAALLALVLTLLLSSASACVQQRVTGTNLWLAQQVTCVLQARLALHRAALARKTVLRWSGLTSQQLCNQVHAAPEGHAVRGAACCCS
jgi:hypothetical protein